MAAPAAADLSRTNLDATLATFLANLLRYALLVGAFVACLGAVGFQTTRFAVITGAAGLALEPMPLLFRPFRRGDTVGVASNDRNGSVNWQLRAWCKTEEYGLVHQAIVRGAKQVLDPLRTGKPKS